VSVLLREAEYAYRLRLSREPDAAPKASPVMKAKPRNRPIAMTIKTTRLVLQHPVSSSYCQSPATTATTRRPRGAAARGQRERDDRAD